VKDAVRALIVIIQRHRAVRDLAALLKNAVCRALIFHHPPQRIADIPEQLPLVELVPGKIPQLTRNKGRIAGSVTAGSVMVDGSGVGDIGNVVLRDRKLLSEDGIFTVVITLNKQTGALLAQPEILSRGFVYEKNSEELLKETP